jgi:hypothetical protein
MPRWSEVVRLPGGGTAIVCYSGHRPRGVPCVACGRRSSLQCDYPVSPGKTCDAYICTVCAKPQGPNRDYCPCHESGLFP